MKSLIIGGIILIVGLIGGLVVIERAEPPTFGPYNNVLIKSVEPVAEAVDPRDSYDHGFIGLKVILVEPVKIKNDLVDEFFVDLNRGGALQLFIPMMVHKDNQYELYELRLQSTKSSVFYFVGAAIVTKLPSHKK